MTRSTPPPNPNASIFGLPWPLSNSSNTSESSSIDDGPTLRLDRRQDEASPGTREVLEDQDSGVNLFYPPYEIDNAYGPLADKTAYVS